MQHKVWSFMGEGVEREERKEMRKKKAKKKRREGKEWWPIAVVPMAAGEWSKVRRMKKKK